jgi:hypothetical protein
MIFHVTGVTVKFAAACPEIVNTNPKRTPITKRKRFAVISFPSLCQIDGETNSAFLTGF